MAYRVIERWGHIKQIRLLLITYLKQQFYHTQQQQQNEEHCHNILKESGLKQGVQTPREIKHECDV